MLLNRHIKKVFFILAITAGIFSCDNDATNEQEENPKITKLKLPANFNVDHLYTPSEHDHGSWVAMAFDDKGRLITSDQYGALYRLELSPAGEDTIRSIQRLDIGKTKGGAGRYHKGQNRNGLCSGVVVRFQQSVRNG